MNTNRFFQWMLAAAMLMSLGTVTTSCSDDDVASGETVQTMDPEEQPIEDALTVTSNHSYVMYGEFDEEFGNALGRRMQGAMTSPTMAEVFVIDPSAVNKSDIMTAEELKTMIQRTESGEASVVLTKATFREFYDWAQLYVLGYLLLGLENYNGDFGYDSPQAAPARRRMANIMRNAYMVGQKQTAATRGTTVNGQELDWEHVNTWPAEQQNAVMFDGFAQSGDNELFVMNAAVTLNADAEVEHPQSDYEWGHKADAVAHWLNNQDAKKAGVRAGLKHFAQAVTRAGGDANIKSLMSAQTKEFVFDYQYPFIINPSVRTAYSTIKVQYTAYSSYDFGGNMEYYQVRQNITVMNSNIYHEVGKDIWIVRENDGAYKTARGAWMKRIDTKMWLMGNGTKSVVSSQPQNANGSSSAGSFSVTTGSTDGYSIGLTESSARLLASDLIPHTDRYSESTNLTWDTSTIWKTNDLTTVCTQSNDDDGTVTWKHTGYAPNDFSSTESDQVKTLQKSTCATDEQVLWRVQNPSGIYTLKASFNVVSEIAKIKGSYDEMPVFVTQENPYDISFELNAPDRFKVKWNNCVVNYGSLQDNFLYTREFDSYLLEDYGISSSNKCWSGLFITTEATADGSDNARAVFQTFKNSIAGMKVKLYKSGIRGQLVFGLKRDGSSSLVDKITLDMDNPYGEGEMLAEEVNGYQLTFIVTKKNQEVELHDVPVNFTGELVIPEQIQIDENVQLKVTSLGKDCAIGRKGITAITIPTTIRTIKYEALAELNITEINIPEGVKTIEKWAFHLDNQLKKVYLPSTLTAIKNAAFSRSGAITEIHIKAKTPPSVGTYGLSPAYKSATLYVPTGCKDTYANANYWKSFPKIVEE